MKTQHPVRLAQRPILGHQPIGIRLSRKPMRRPGRGQRPIEIHRFLENGLEPAGQAGVGPGGASSDLLAPTAYTASPIMDQSEFGMPI